MAFPPATTAIFTRAETRMSFSRQSPAPFRSRRRGSIRRASRRSADRPSAPADGNRASSRTRRNKRRPHSQKLSCARRHAHAEIRCARVRGSADKRRDTRRRKNRCPRNRRGWRFFKSLRPALTPPVFRSHPLKFLCSLPGPSARGAAPRWKSPDAALRAPCPRAKANWMPVSSAQVEGRQCKRRQFQGFSRRPLVSFP